MAKKQPLFKNGAMVGPYRIIRLVGEGGMGEVYEAIDLTLNRQAAIKVITPALIGDELVVKRFVGEGQTLAKLNHQNVVTVYALGVESGIHYLAMEFVNGRPLNLIIKNEPLSFHDVLFYMEQILEGCIALHEAGIIHRDLKPKNLIINRENLVKIVDFGVAKSDGTQLDFDLTSKGMLVGSVSYLAPEIIRGEPASVQSDIWSLGIIFYEMLFRARPFGGENTLQILERIKTEELRFPSGSRRDLPEGIQWIIYKMCEKTTEGRYESIAEILSDIRDCERQSEKSKKASTSIFNLAQRDATREQILRQGFDDEDVSGIINTALHIQSSKEKSKWRNLELVSGVLKVKVDEAALFAAMSAARKGKFQSLRAAVYRSKRLSSLGVAAAAMILGWYLSGGIEKISLSKVPAGAQSAEFTQGRVDKETSLEAPKRSPAKNLPTSARAAEGGTAGVKVHHDFAGGGAVVHGSSHSKQLGSSAKVRREPKISVAKATRRTASNKRVPPNRGLNSDSGKSTQRKSKTSKAYHRQGGHPKDLGASNPELLPLNEEGIGVPMLPLETPRTRSPIHGISVVPLKGGDVPLVFVWSEIQGAASYRVEIRAAQSKKKVITRSTTEPVLVIKEKLPPGKYVWYVRAEAGALRSKRSPASAFEITEP